jgi:hypothetical protein
MVRLESSRWYLWIETANPPQPVPLTVEYMPFMSIGIGEEHREPISSDPILNLELQIHVLLFSGQRSEYRHPYSITPYNKCTLNHLFTALYIFLARTWRWS